MGDITNNIQGFIHRKNARWNWTKKKLKKNLELTATTSNYFQRFRFSIFVARFLKKTSFHLTPANAKFLSWSRVRTRGRAQWQRLNSYWNIGNRSRIIFMIITFVSYLATGKRLTIIAFIKDHIWKARLSQRSA